MPTKERATCARYNRTDAMMWGGESFGKLSPLPPSGQSLWLFFMTCPERNEIGIWRMGLGAIQDYTRWDPLSVENLLAELVQQGMVVYDPSARVIMLTKALTRAQCQSPNVAQAWGKLLSSLPTCALKGQRIEELKAFMKDLGQAYLEAFTKGLGQALRQGIGQGIPEGMGQSRTRTRTLSRTLSRTRIESPPTPPDQSPNEREPWEDTAKNFDESEQKDLEQEGFEKINPEDTDQPLNPVLRETRDAVKKLRREEGFKTLGDAAGIFKPPVQPEDEIREILAGLFDPDAPWNHGHDERFTDSQAKGLIRRGLRLQMLRRIDGSWKRMTTGKGIEKPIAYAYRLLDTEVSAHVTP